MPTEVAQNVYLNYGVLAILGVVNDPTTAGVNDSDRAMTYTEPSKGDRID